MGGLETTSIASIWIMAELLRNSRVLKKAQDEVRRVVGTKGKVEMQDIIQMSYLKCIVKETLRLHPPGPLLAPRETAAKVEVGGYEIPAKTSVLVNAWAIQRQPDSWDNPEEFIPERFEEKPVDFNGQDFRLIPFGFGRRRCPGMAFALASIECLIANLLYWFDWKLLEGDGLPENMDMTEEFKLSLEKKVPLHVVPIQFIA